LYKYSSVPTIQFERERCKHKVN